MGKGKSKKLFVLDTNVLIHDPSALFRFKNNDIFLPMVVLEELDNHKKGVSEIARNVRQVTRYLDELIKANPDKNKKTLGAIPLSLISHGKTQAHALGKLYFQTTTNNQPLPMELPGSKVDNTILETALSLIAQGHHVKLISMDINLRIKASVLGVDNDDYYEDYLIEDSELLYRGVARLPDDFWQQDGKQVRSWQDQGGTYYAFKGPLSQRWHPKQFLYSNNGDDFACMVMHRQNDETIVRLIKDYSSENQSVWGIRARNQEQNFALNLLMDPEVDFVSLVGMAGTGKTLLTLASALTQTLDKNIYNEIIMTRVTVPLGEDIGFLPGTEEEKMTPWMGALMDNLEVLAKPSTGGQWGQAATADLISNRIKIRSANFMRGRTFLNKFLIIDEAQNLTAKQMRTLVTRAGPGTKVICLGNIAQIDTPYLSETTSGLTFVVDRFKTWEHSGHVTLTRGERSRLADFAAEAL